MIATLAAATLLQPKLDFGPEIVSLADLCRAYAPEGTEVQIGGLDDRFVVAHLRNRSWPQLQSLLAQEMGIEFVQEPNRPLVIKMGAVRSAEENRQGSLAMNAISRAIRDRAAELLVYPNGDWEALVREHDELQQALYDRVAGFQAKDWREFAETNRIDLLRFGRLHIPWSLPRWASLQLLHQRDSGSLETTKPFTWFGPPEQAYSGWRLPSPQTSSKSTLSISQSMDWTSFSIKLDSTLSEPHEAMAEVPQVTYSTLHTWLSFPEAERALLGIWKTPPALDALDEVPEALETFSVPDQASGLIGETLEAWAEQTGGELLAEIHPLVDLGQLNTAPPPTKNLAEFVRFYSTRPKTSAALPAPVSAEDANRPLYPIDITYVANHLLASQQEPTVDSLDRMRREYSVQNHDGVLVMRLTAWSYLDRLNVDSRNYFAVVDGITMPLDRVKEYVRTVDSETNARWSCLVQGADSDSIGYFRDLVRLHPFLKGVLASGQWEDFVGAISPRGITLSGDAVAQAWKGLALMGDPTARLVEAKILPNAPLRIRVRYIPQSPDSRVVVVVDEPFDPPGVPIWAGQLRLPPSASDRHAN